MTWLRKHKRWWVPVLLVLAVPFALAEWIMDGDRFPSTTNELEELNTFPVLMLKLGDQWSDFELKASTDNFESMVYFVKSSELLAESDPDVWVYFTDDHSLDQRKWRKAVPGVPIMDQLTSPANSEVEYIIVSPSHQTPVDWSTWMYETNKKLVWSYIRYDGMNLEMNASGSLLKWNSVVPVDWRKERIEP